MPRRNYPAPKPTQRAIRQAMAAFAPLDDAPPEDQDVLAPKPRAKRAHPEDDLHLAVAKVLRHALPPDVIWWHTPNQGRRSIIEGAKYKAMGMLAGVADLVIIWPEAFGPQIGFIELKAGSSTSAAQKEFGARVIEAGCKWTVAKSIEDVLAALHKWGCPCKVGLDRIR